MTASKEAPGHSSLFEGTGARLEAAAEVARVSEDTLERLRLPRSVLKVSIPVRMDDGSLQTFPGFRAPGALALARGTPARAPASATTRRSARRRAGFASTRA